MLHKILAIDDSHTLRRFIENSLSQHSPDYRVVTAQNGAEGVKLALQEQPDLILLDFMLPDMNGDEVCRRLVAEPSVATIPVIFMSSDAAEIKRVETQFPNVKRSITKPFTQELLCATVSRAFREFPPARPPAPASPPPAPTPAPDATANPGAEATPPAQTIPLLSGTTAVTPLISLLRGIESLRLTGLLHLHHPQGPIHAHFHSGALLVTTSPDPDLYLSSELYKISIPENILATVKDRQRQTGQPSFLSLGLDKLIDEAQSVTLSHEYGLHLFARAWTSGPLRYQFTEHPEPPPWTTHFPPHKNGMDDWAMTNLRLVGKEYQTAQAWGEPTGIPAFTLRGYRTLQHVALSERETRFASQVSSGGLSLQQIAQQMNLPIEKVEIILFRFISMEVIDYWPASIFQQT